MRSLTHFQTLIALDIFFINAYLMHIDSKKTNTLNYLVYI